MTLALLYIRDLMVMGQYVFKLAVWPLMNCPPPYKPVTQKLLDAVRVRELLRCLFVDPFDVDD